MEQITDREECSVDIYYMRFKDLLSSERHQSCRELRSSCCAFVYRIQRFFQRIVIFEAGEMHLREGKNRSQRIVKIVRYPACKIAYNFHTLRMTQLLFGIDPVCHIGADACCSEYFTG